MTSITLVRLHETEDLMLGALVHEGRILGQTLELPWKSNERSVSCIPADKYLCKWQESPRFGWCYHVTCVPSRDHILIHAGNTTSDTTGCILLGTTVGRLSSRPAVLSSRAALDRLHEEFAPSPIILNIKELV
jgi:hypothetical protein